MTFLKFTNLERELYILNILEDVLSNLFNSYKANLFYLNNSNDSDIFTSIKSINMNISVNSEFVLMHLKSLKKPIDDYSILEANQDISHNIIMSILHRLLFIDILNKLCRTIDFDTKSKLFFTKGNVILLHKQHLPILKKLLLHNKFPKAIAERITVTKNESLYDFINNKNYSYNIWLESFSNKIDLYSAEILELKNIKYDSTRVVSILNYLNYTKISIDSIYYKNIISIIKKSNMYTNIINSERHNIDRNVHLHEVSDNLCISSNKDNIDFIDFTLIDEQISILINHSKDFYISYVLDRRSRIYIKQWPINYQLNHLIRSVIRLNNEYIKIYRTFFLTKKLHYTNICDFWRVNRLVNANDLIAFLKKYNFTFDISSLKNNNFLSNDKSLDDLIKLDSIILLLMSLAPKRIVRHCDRLKFGIENFEGIKSNLATTLPDEIFDKNYIELHKIIYSIDNIILNNHGDIYFADASSNALQLVTLAMGTDSRLLLELLNIINNTTKYRNIYFYVLDKLKMLNYENSIKIVKNVDISENSIIIKRSGNSIKWDNEKINSLLSIEVIKSMIMPAAYGKTMYTNYETCNQYLLQNNNDVWSNISIEIRKKICALWWINSFEILKSIGLDLEEHITLCKTNKLSSGYVYNHFYIPIITHAYKITDRLCILKTIKIYKNNLNKLCRDCNINTKEVNTLQFTTIYKNYGKLGEKILNILKKIDKLNEKMTKSDIDTRRIVVRILKKRYQFRVPIIQKRSKNTQKLNSAITPNITHAYDAAVLMATLEKLKNLNISSLCIHDSIGSDIQIINIVIYLYKETLIESITLSMGGVRYYPYKDNIPYTLAGIDYINEIMDSDNLFI